MSVKPSELHQCETDFKYSGSIKKIDNDLNSDSYSYHPHYCQHSLPSRQNTLHLISEVIKIIYDAV